MPTQKYIVDGKRVPGTTTIIKASLGWGLGGLMYWAWEQGNNGLDFREERDKASEAGTIAHALAEADIKGIPPPKRPFEPSDSEIEAWKKAELCFSAYREWKSRSKLELIASEVSFVSSEYRFGGTIDAAARFGEKIELVDFKNTKGTYPDHLIQLAGYKYLWERGTPFLIDKHPCPSAIDGIHLLRFSPGGDFHHSYFAAPRMDKPWVAFTHLRSLYDLKKDLEAMV